MSVTVRPIITLLTDFGTRDGYLGAMKGMIYSELPSAEIVDISHDIPPQDVRAGAFVLAQAAPFFPPGTVHIAVVDPGVGTARRALIVEDGGQLMIGPDNGLLMLAASEGWARAVDRIPPDWSIHPTFHGRDLFARIGARLAGGIPPEHFAKSAVAPVKLPLPVPQHVGADLWGEVIHIDRFGNLVTNIPGERGVGMMITLADEEFACHGTYGDVAPGELLGYCGSTGYLEIAVRDGSAAARLGSTRGQRLRLR